MVGIQNEVKSNVSVQSTRIDRFISLHCLSYQRLHILKFTTLNSKLSFRINVFFPILFNEFCFPFSVNQKNILLCVLSSILSNELLKTKLNIKFNFHLVQNHFIWCQCHRRTFIYFKYKSLFLSCLQYVSTQPMIYAQANHLGVKRRASL